MKTLKTLVAVAMLALATLAQAQIVVKTDAGDFKLRLIGRTNLDMGTYLTDHLDNRNGVSLNDTRLGVQATFDDVWSAKIEIRYSEKAISFRDLWIGYKINDKNSLKAGNFFQPFGSKILGLNYRFVENASADNAFCPNRKMGLAWSYVSDPFNLTAGIFTDGDVDGKNMDQGYSLTAKAIARPIIDDKTILHIGAAPMFTKSPNSVTFKGTMPTTIASHSFITTPKMETDNVFRSEIEAIFISGKFYAEARYLMAKTSCDNEDNDIFGQGFFAQASFLLKGDQQKYNKSTGLAAPPAPKSLEVLARVSHVDLDIYGKMTDVTIGLNYYFNKNVNVKANYVACAVKDADTHHLAQMRLQFSF